MMSYREELIKLLSSREHIGAALDIGEAIQDVKKRLHRRFWEGTYEKLQDGLVKDGLSDQWSIEGLDELLRDSTKNYSGLSVVLRPHADSARLLVGIWRDGGRLWRGVSYDREQPCDHPLREIKDLRNAIEKDLSKPQSVWQVGWQWSDVYLDSKDFLIPFAFDDEMFTEDIAESVLSILRDHADMLAAADTALDRAENRYNRTD